MRKSAVLWRSPRKKRQRGIFSFGQTSINISTQGQKRLGAALGSRSYLEEYVSEKVNDWVGQVVKLAEFAAPQPQACYAAYTFGLKLKWTYYLRTLSDIEELPEPLERAISDVLIPSITGHTCTTSKRELLALLVRKGGLGLENPVERARFEHPMCLQVTAPLVAQIVSQAHEPPDDALIRSLQITTRKERHVRLDNKLEDLRNSLPEKTKRAVDLATEKGALRWLTVIPVKEIDLNLNKREFKDAVHLRYDWQISGVPNVCVCPLMSMMQ